MCAFLVAVSSSASAFSPTTPACTDCACCTQSGIVRGSLGDAKSLLGDAKSSLGDAESSLGDVKSLWVTR